MVPQSPLNTWWFMCWKPGELSPPSQTHSNQRFKGLFFCNPCLLSDQALDVSAWHPHPPTNCRRNRFWCHVNAAVKVRIKFLLERAVGAWVNIGRHTKKAEVDLCRCAVHQLQFVQEGSWCFSRVCKALCNRTALCWASECFGNSVGTEMMIERTWHSCTLSYTVLSLGPLVQLWDAAF